MYNFEEIDYNLIDLNEYNNFKNKSIFTTREWINFVIKDSKTKPLILRITDDCKFIGYFSSLITYKFGIKIVGSPFNGWSTCWMGFDVVDGINKIDIVQPTINYIFKSQNALFIQIIDRDFQCEDAQKRNFQYTNIDTLELRINYSDEDLFKFFKNDCRTFIRQFERRGATLEQVAPCEDFAVDYYKQLKDVFAKQGMLPTYNLSKVIHLMNNFKDSENILCLRVVDPEGICIATSIFIGYNKKFFFWGGASYRSGQNYRPNEYMIWSAIKFWRDKGYDYFDMVGARDYKRKFGPYDVRYSCLEFSKFPFLIILKRFSQNIFFGLLKIKGKLTYKM